MNTDWLLWRIYPSSWQRDWAFISDGQQQCITLQYNHKKCDFMAFCLFIMYVMVYNPNPLCTACGLIRWHVTLNIASSATCYLDRSALCGRGARAVVLRSHLSVLRPFQEVLCRSRLPAVPVGLGPLQRTAQLLGYFQVLLMFWNGLLLLEMDRIPAGRLILFLQLCFRIETMVHFVLEPRRGAGRKTEEINQVEMQLQKLRV